jgi:hypothetical protein
VQPLTPDERLLILQGRVNEILDEESDLARAAWMYLSSNLHYVLWANWVLSDLGSRLLAARWLAFQYTELSQTLTHEYDTYGLVRRSSHESFTE